MFDQKECKGNQRYWCPRKLDQKSKEILIKNYIIYSSALQK